MGECLSMHYQYDISNVDTLVYANNITHRATQREGMEVTALTPSLIAYLTLSSA